MAVAILDAMSITSGAFTASRAISAGSNRIAFRAVTYGHGSDAAPPTTAPTWGGQTMTLLANVDTAGHDVIVAVYYLLEAGIAAMSGSTLSTPDGTFAAANQGDITWSVSGAEQAAPAFNSAATTGTSGSLSLARVADSVTAAISAHDISNNYGASTNPATTSVEIAAQNTTAYGAVVDTARTVSYTWSNGFNRDDASIVMNIAPVAVGPTILSITDPISDSITITLSEAAPTVDTIEITVGSRTEAQSYTTGDNTTFTIASISRATLPPIAASATVRLKAGATEIVSTTVELDPRTGYSAWVASGIDFTITGLAYNHTGDVPVDGDIAEISDHPNTTLGGTESASPWTVAQTVSRSFDARIWQASTETWGATAVIPYDAIRRKLYATALEATGLSATALSATSL